MYKYSIKFYKDKYVKLDTIRKRINYACKVYPNGVNKRPYTFEEFKNSIPEDIRVLFNEQVIMDAYLHSKSLLQTNVDQDKVFNICDFTQVYEETHYRIRHYRPRIIGLPAKALTTQQMVILDSLNTDLYGIRYLSPGFNLKGTLYVDHR